VFSRCLLMIGLALSLLTLAAHAETESRLALLIGNSAYRSSPLANPVNDVRLMESALKDAGFTVIKAENASIREMRRLVRDFGDKLKASGGVGLFYFAGHGVQVRGENFLVSTDSDIRNEEEVADDAVNASVILDRMQSAGNRMNLIILDACRNNPFAVRSRTAVSGLANMNAPSGSLVAYATAPGSVASDGNGKNGLYTQHLARVIRESSLPVEEVFKQVRAAVRHDSNNQQTPWENTALEGQFFFKAPVQVVAPAPAPVTVRPSGPDSSAMEMALWDSAKTATTVGELQAYLNRYPNGFFSDMAKARIAAISSSAGEKAAEAAQKAANERAASEAAKRLATERASAEAAQKVASEQASSEVARKLAAERAAAEAAQKLTSERSRPQAGQQTVALVPNQVAEIPSQGVLRAGDVVGTLVMKDTLTGLKTNVPVTVRQSSAERTVFSTGDVIAKDGRVLQVKVGDVVLRVESGALWTIPLKVGTSGKAEMGRADVTQALRGSLEWQTVATGDGKIQIVADVSYRTASNYSVGKWLAVYAGGFLPESFSTDVKGSGGKNMVSGELTKTNVALVSSTKTSEPPGHGAQRAGDVIGTLVMKDTLTGIKTNVDVTVLESNPEKTVYSTGDVIAQDGRVLQVKVGDVALRVESGALWTIPLKAGTSGTAKIKRADASIDAAGTLNWKAVGAGDGKIQLVAAITYRSSGVEVLGTWQAVYAGHFLPESFSTSINGSGAGTASAIRNTLSAELRLR